MAGRRKAPPRTKRTPPPSREPLAGEANTALVPTAQPEPQALVIAGAADLVRASELAEQSDASETRRAYRADAMAWVEYCTKVGAAPFPADAMTVVSWIASFEQKGHAISTVRRRLAALARVHRERKLDRSGLEDPSVKRTLRGYAKVHGSEPKKKRALEPDIVRLALLSDDFSVRDKAILAVGFVTGMRRSEIAGMEWSDVEQEPDGFVITIRRHRVGAVVERGSKTDKEGNAQIVAVPYAKDKDLCAARAFIAWKRRCGHKNGPVFRCSAQTVYRVVLRAAEAAGYDPSEFGAHSMRAGLLTSATQGGVSLGITMNASRHTDANVAAGYVRSAEALKNAAFQAAADAIAKKD